MARAWADVDLDAVRANVRALAAVSGPAEVCAVVKAGGYGHGAVPIARAALDAGASWLAVAQVSEAVELRDAGLTAPLLLLSQPRDEEISAAVATDVRVTAYDAGFIEELAQAASPGSPTKVHLKVDTGMHRVGAPPAEMISLARAVVASDSLALEGVWTHCAVADEPANDFTGRQMRRYETVLAELAAASIDVPVKHAANSAAAISHPATRYDMVRCGIAVYGIPPSPALDGAVDLQPALRLTTEVAHVQQVAAGEGISYGLRYRPDRDTVVATLPVGYADGVVRALSAAGQSVLIGGRRLPMAGVVTMDQVMVDCGPGSDVRPGDEAVLLGAQAQERITPGEWAGRLGTISYEIVCAIGPRVERRYNS